MGVAKIISHSGKGLYAIELQYRTQLILKKRDDLAKEIKELNEDLEGYQENLTELQEELEYTEITLNTLINSPLFPLTGSDIAAGITTKEEKRQNDLRQFTRKITSLEREIIFVEEQINLNEIRFETADKERILYEEHSDDPILLEAWCVEYNVDLKADDFVETIEINDEYNEPNTKINIRPVTAKTIPELQDKVELEGRLFKTVLEESIPQAENPLNSEKWTIAWNWMTLPAMQRWRPLYRIGRITAMNIATQKCNLTYNEQEYHSSVLPFPNFLDAVDFTGGEGKYSIELKTAEENVPIIYMDSGAEEFEVDDIVVVEYKKRDYLSPQVIGYHENPRRRSIQYLVYIDNSTDRVLAREVGNTGNLDKSSVIDLLESGATIGSDNLTNGRRLNYGQLLTVDDKGIEKKDIFTFKKYAVYKNGVEIDLSNFVSFEVYLVNIAYPGLPSVIKQAWNKIMAVEAHGGRLYVLAFTNFIQPSERFTKYYEYIDLFGNPQTLIYGYADARGFRLFEFSLDDYFLINVGDIPTELTILAEYAKNAPISQGLKYYHFNGWDYQKPVTGNETGPNGGLLEEVHASINVYNTNNTREFSKIFGFTINDDYIIFSFATRKMNLLLKPSNKTTHVMLIEKTGLKLLSHIWSTIGTTINTGLSGACFGSEELADKFNYDPINDPDNENIDGKVKIQGMSESEELEADTFASIGEVI